MSDSQVRVTLQPSGQSVYVLPGTSLLEAAARAGLAIDTPCGGNGTCGKCRVQITEGADTPTSAEQEVISDENLDAGWRLACQSVVQNNLRVYVPESSVIGAPSRIQETAATGDVPEVEPAVYKRYVELSQPTLEDDDPDVIRLEKSVGEFTADLSLLKELPHLLRNQNFAGTVVFADRQLIGFEKGDTSAECYGAVFDIGTTTIVGELLHLCNGRNLAVRSRMNPQVSRGDDVLSRIRHSGSCPGCLDELQQMVLDEVKDMIEEMAGEAEIEQERIYEVVFAGNTTMQHLLCGLNTVQLGEIPFVPVQGHGLFLESGDLNLPIHPRGMAYVFPVIGGFVGGDTVAGMVASRLPEQDGPTLMVDIGTNGEIVLVHNGTVKAASTAAGPAFEGARISQGMRATRGAVEKVVITDDVECSVIGDVEPAGICGSALIDLVSELRRVGAVTPEGRLLPPEEMPEDVPEGVAERVSTNGEGVRSIRLSKPDADTGGREVVVTQLDFRELQLAAGAIRAGVSILLRNEGLSPTDLESVLLAGGFGSFIRRKHAQRIGLLPGDIEHHRIHYVGNVALSGAKWALLSRKAKADAEKFVKQTEHTELSTDTSFQMEFAEAMIFPAIEEVAVEAE